MRDLDPSLRPLVEAPAEADEHLAALIEEATPIARGIVARKLGAFGGRQAPGFDEDLEDIVGDALLALVSRLQSLRGDPDAEPIASFRDYAAVVAHNAFTHFLRRRHPERSRLKHRLRYVLTRDARFGLWRSGDGLVCGLAASRGRAAAPDAAEALDRLALDRDRWRPLTGPGSTRDPDEGGLLRGLLDAIGGPVDFDRLVGVVAALTATRRAGRADIATLDTLPDAAPGGDRALQDKRDAARAWEEIARLPLRQRHALLLSLRDERGGSVLWVLPLTGTASIRQIAQTLEMPDLELAGMWDGLPLDDLAIAARLGCTRQQVINLRGAARKRLGHRLASPAPPRAANTAPLSASFGEDT